MKCKDAINTGTQAYPRVRTCDKKAAHEGWHTSGIGMVLGFPNMQGNVSWPSRTYPQPRMDDDTRNS